MKQIQISNNSLFNSKFNQIEQILNNWISLYIPNF